MDATKITLYILSSATRKLRQEVCIKEMLSSMVERLGGEDELWWYLEVADQKCKYILFIFSLFEQYMLINIHASVLT